MVRGLGQSQLTAMQDLQAEIFHEFIGRVAGVGQGDNHEICLHPAKVTGQRDMNEQ